jgi:hypothetical protein
MNHIENKLYRMGLDDYRQGKQRDDNPFDIDLHPRSHEMWDWGWCDQYAYTEHQAAISVNHK